MSPEGCASASELNFTVSCGFVAGVGFGFACAALSTA
jgi:hypothetical protein